MTFTPQMKPNMITFLEFSIINKYITNLSDCLRKGLRPSSGSNETHKQQIKIDRTLTEKRKASPWRNVSG